MRRYSTHVESLRTHLSCVKSLTNTTALPLVLTAHVIQRGTSLHSVSCFAPPQSCIRRGRNSNRFARHCSYHTARRHKPKGTKLVTLGAVIFPKQDSTMVAVRDQEFIHVPAS